MLIRLFQAFGLLAILNTSNALAASPTKSGPLRSVEITTQFFDIPASLQDPFMPDRSLQVDSTDPMPPGIIALKGVLTKAQLDIALKDVRNNKEVDTATLPSLFARSGSRAKLLMVQEVRYGSEFSVGQKGAPPIPTKFDTKDVGVTMGATPTIGADGYTIDLELSPRLVRLAGYQELGGSPVYFKRQSVKDLAVAVLPAEFPVNNTVQPIFSSQEVTTSVTLYDGSSVILGGLTTNHTQTGEKRYAFMVITANLVSEPSAGYSASE